MTAALIETRELTYSYHGGGNALSAISLRIDAAQSVALIGANGAGKSTLLLALGGLIPVRREALLLRGVPADTHALRREAGLLLQDPEDQIFAPTVVQDVAFGLVQRGCDQRHALALAEEALEQMGIAHLASRPIRALSLGEKKRTALAGLVVLRPALLLLDEPTAGLDHTGTTALEATLEDLRRQGTAIVMSTHDTDFALRGAEQVAVLHSGRLLAHGAARTLLANEELLSSARLAMPACIAVAAEMSRAFPVCATWPPPTTREELRQYFARLASQAGDQFGDRVERIG